MVKLYEKEPYKKALVPKKIRAYIDLLRPFTLLAPLIGGISGALLGLAVDPLPGYDNRLVAPVISSNFPYFSWDFPFLELLWGVVTLMMINAGSNALNQVYDAKIDKINKPYRPIPKKIVTKDEARTIAWIIYLVILWRAATFSVEAEGRGAFAFFILVIMIVTIFYSVPPVRLKKRLWTNNFSIAATRGLLGFVAAWCIFGDYRNPTPWIIGLIMGIYLIGAVTTKDFTDFKGDKKYGMKTLPIHYGRTSAIALSAPFFVLPFLLIPLAIWRNRLIPETMWMSVLILWGAYIVFLLYKYAEVPDEKFENSPVWKHMYLMLMAIQIGFCVSYLYDYFY